MSQSLRTAVDGAVFLPLGLWVLFGGIAWELYVPYLAGAVTLIIGIVGVRKQVSMA